MLLNRAFLPKALLLTPVVLNLKELHPIAVLEPPVVLQHREEAPNAEL
jgi:hypothetical protein